MNTDQMYDVILLALCCWREARGESLPAKEAMCWSVRNRVDNPSWWGRDWCSVILKPFQYSSFNIGDPNATKWPNPLDLSWQACLKIAQEVYALQIPDPTGGATHYFDKSLDAKPPAWAAEMKHTCDVGALRFYRL